MGTRTVFLPHTASTSDEAMAEAGAGAPHGTVVVADAQSGGRGRQGRSWHSPAGENLYVSVLLRPDLSPAALPPLTLTVGAAVAATLRTHGVGARVKWPNDVLLSTPAGFRKVAGVLAETSTMGGWLRHLVIGVGINVNGTTFPDELAARATSCRLIAGRPLSRVRILGSFLRGFEGAFEDFVRGGPAAAVARMRPLALLGVRCRIERAPEPIVGTSLDVDDDGALLVGDAAGQVHRVVSGEVLQDL
jgi:BirA family biotin operon repressor/biotin-[acetyl-CoA-carboxylase] ligase